MNNTTTIHLDYPATENIMDILATVSIIVWTLNFFRFITSIRNNNLQQPQLQPTGSQDTIESWMHVGTYHLNKPQQLPKAERDALSTIGDIVASRLYQKTYSSGNTSWRYRIGDIWFYPHESAVRKRGLDLYGNHIHEIVD